MLRRLVQAAVLEDVHLDARAAGGRSPLPCGVDSLDDVELLRQPFGAESVRDLEVRRMVGQRQVLAAQQPGRVRHRLDRRPCRRTSRCGRAGRRGASPSSSRAAFGTSGWAPAAAQSVQYSGTRPSRASLDDLEGPVADPFGPFEPAVLHPGRELFRSESGDNSRGFPECLHLERRGQLAFKPECDLVEGVDGSMAPSCTHLPGTTGWCRSVGGGGSILEDLTRPGPDPAGNYVERSAGRATTGSLELLQIWSFSTGQRSWWSSP